MKPRLRKVDGLWRCGVPGEFWVSAYSPKHAFYRWLMFCPEVFKELPHFL